MKKLIIAAGGGGDAFTAGVIAEMFDSDEIIIASFSWDRIMYDPDPGPRKGVEFDNVTRFGKYNTIISKASKLKKVGSKSFLPVISQYFNRDYFLLELDDGVKHLHNQIVELVDMMIIEKIIILDIGGDILATGKEKELKSPIADASVLAACKGLKIPVSIWVAGCGLDGELSEETLMTTITSLNNVTIKHLPDDLAKKHMVAFEWLPSEASALFFMASIGNYGICEIRQDGYSVELSKFSAAIYCIDFFDVYNKSLIAKNIQMTTSLDEIETIVKNITSISELDIERKKRTKVQTWNDNRTSTEIIKILLKLSSDKKEKGVSFMTRRRICEILQIKGEKSDQFISYLKANYPDCFVPPLWRCN